MQKQKFPDRIIFILSLFVYKALSRKEQVVTVFSNEHIVDRISLCSMVFHKVEIVLSYIESGQNIRTQRGSCIQSIPNKK